MSATADWELENSSRVQTGNSTAQSAAIVGVSALVAYAITRRWPLALGVALGGSALVSARQNGKRDSQERSAETSILVNTTPEEAFRFWRNFENLPRFMTRLKTVNVLDNQRSVWEAAGPMGQTIRWDSEVIDERENEYIAWRSLPGGDIQVAGVVRFTRAPADRGTLIRATLEFTGSGGAFSKMLKKGAKFLLRQDLKRLEALMEAGEIPTIEGQSHGPRDLVTAVARVADPARPMTSDASTAVTQKRSIA